MIKCLDIDKTLQYFSLFCDIDTPPSSAQIEICQNSESKIISKLTDNSKEPSSNDLSLLCQAAGADAYLTWLMLEKNITVNCNEIKVGDITVKNNDNSINSECDNQQIKKYFFSQIAHLIKPEYKALIGVGE